MITVAQQAMHGTGQFSSSAVPSMGPTVVPEAFGNAIPRNSKDLLKFIRAQKLNKQSGTSLQNSSNAGLVGNLSKERLKMLDEQRELMELRMMALEDYFYLLHEKSRVSRLDEISKMETEDILSANLTVIFKQYDYERFKANLVKQVELREAQEKADREAKRKAAEERRKAVVERLRLQAEMEERRKREAEEAIQRLQEEKARQEEKERNRLESDRVLIVFEDQMSLLVEQDYREMLERKQWQQREREKLLAWEEEQKKKDIIEEEKRKLRMVELEEKKRKLEILRQQQAKSKSADVDIKEEQDRLNKQLRIQNKAKFVSKRAGQQISPAISDSNNSNIDTSSTEINQLSQEVAFSNTEQPRSAINDTSYQHRKVADNTSQLTVNYQVNSEMETLKDQYRSELLSVITVEELREKLKLISQDKRAVRLEQRKIMATSNDNNAIEELQRQLATIDVKFMLIEERIQELNTNAALKNEKSVENESSTCKASSKITTNELNANDSSKSLSLSRNSSKPAPLHRGISATAMQLKQVQNPTAVSAVDSAYSVKSAGVQGCTKTSATTVSNGVDGLLRDVDRVLREGQRLLDEGRLLPTGLVDISTLLVSMSTLEKKIQASAQSTSALQSLGYYDRLGNIQIKLRELLQLLQENPYVAPSSSKPISRVSTPKVSSRPQSDSNKRTAKVESSEYRDTTASDSDDSKNKSSKFSASVTSSNQATAESAKLQRQSSFSEKELVVRIDQDLAALNSHTILAASESAPVILQPSSKFEVISNGKEKDIVAQADNANTHKEGELEEEEEEDPEKLPGWVECINSSLFYSAAHHAAYFGFLEVLQFLCKYFDCFVMDEKGRTPLFYAALNNQLQCVAHLLGLDPRWIDVGDHSGDTLMHAAAMALNNTDAGSDLNCAVLEFLLSCEANPDTANNQGMTPSHIAKSVDALKVLAAHNAQLFCMDNRGRLPIWHACFDNRVNCVSYLLLKTPRSYILWPDEMEGDTCLHVAAKQGHAECIEVILNLFFDASSIATISEKDNGPSGDDCLYVTNKRQYTIAHCAANAAVLRVLYEFGMNLFIPDAKEHMPLFLMAFYNRLDCVVYLLDMATSSTSVVQKSVSQKKSHNNIAHADRQGDTALHIACVAGHGGVIQVLLLYLSNEALRNKQNFRPSDLARKAGHVYLAEMVEYYESIFRSASSDSVDFLVGKNELMRKIFQAYSTYGSRWSKSFDIQYEAVYYVDHVTNEAVWERPPGFDLLPNDDEDFDCALKLLRAFYKKHNPDKMGQINDILFVYRRRYTELFITLAQRYSLSDLTMFKGVHFHDGKVPSEGNPNSSPVPNGNKSASK